MHALITASRDRLNEQTAVLFSSYNNNNYYNNNNNVKESSRRLTNKWTCLTDKQNFPCILNEAYVFKIHYQHTSMAKGMMKNAEL